MVHRTITQQVGQGYIFNYALEKMVDGSNTKKSPARARDFVFVIICNQMPEKRLVAWM